MGTRQTVVYAYWSLSLFISVDRLQYGPRYFFFWPRRWPKPILIDIIHCGHLKDTSNAERALGFSLKQLPLNEQKFLASQGSVNHVS